jgi:hypothetical protein
MKQWNPKAEDASELSLEHSHSAVRKTSYMEVHKLLGTSGCSNDGNQWMWSRLGVMETKRGNLVVNPGDWIAELSNGEAFIVPVVSDDSFLMEIGAKEQVMLITGFPASFEATQSKELSPFISMNEGAEYWEYEWDRTALFAKTMMDRMKLFEYLKRTELP